MSVSVEAKIFRALSDHLDAFVVANPIQVAYPNRGFTPTKGEPYLRPTWLPARTDGFSLKTTNDYTGLFQIDVFWPDQVGIVKPIERAGALAAHFVRGTLLYREGVRVKVQGAPSIAPAMQEPGWVQIPVSIPYRAFA